VEDFLRFALAGFPLGCVYALMALGLVLTYRTSGVFNLAFGAQAYVSAAVYYETRVGYGWPRIPALLLAAVVVGPALGAVLDAVLFRHLRGAPVVARLVAGLGLLVAIPAAVDLWIGSGVKYRPPSAAPDPFRVYRWGTYSLNADQVAAVVATLVLVTVLTVGLRYTALGLRMRAVVESPRLVQLAGVDADRVGAAAWMLSGLMAGVAGVLLAPLFSTLDNNNFTVLLVAAMAAAAFGRLSSLGLTLVGGVLLGVAQQVLAGYLPLGSVLAQGLRPSLPFLLLFLLLVLGVGRQRRREVDDPLAGVDPPTRALVVQRERTRTSLALRSAAAAAAFAVVVFGVSDYWLFLLTTGVVFAIVFLSITLITGMGGMISLCPATFAGVGAFTAGQLAVRWDVPILLGVVAGALVAGLAGAALALPALRLGGVHLALATLAFALMVDNVVFPLSGVSGGSLGLDVPRPVVGPFDFSSDLAFLVLALAVFTVVAAGVVLIRNGTTGRSLSALRGSEVAAAAMGVDPTRATITVFAVSAAVAGLGGGLYASLIGRVSQADFHPLLGLFWVVLVVTLGAVTVEGAAAAGLVLVAFPEFLDWVGLPGGVAFLLFGLGAVTFVRHPEGIVAAQRAAVVRVFARLRLGGVR